MGLLSQQRVSSGRILVVEDDAGARDLIVSSLRADGHDVDASGDGPEALRLLARHWYDVIVSDIQMPALDGPNLYSQVARRWPTGPPHFLFVSRLGTTAEYDGFLKVIKAPVLAQPFKAGQLRRAVRRML
jgi:CheY-like chemotaxis protein